MSAILTAVALLRRILLVLVLLLGQAHDLVPHVHGLAHRHEHKAEHGHLEAARHDHSVSGVQSDHSHDIGHFDRCDQCRANAGWAIPLADLPSSLPILTIPILDTVRPVVPEYRPYLPNAPPPERPSRAPPYGLA